MMATGDFSNSFKDASRKHGEHVPVLSEGVVKGLGVQSGGVYVDATLGMGGHTELLLKESNPSGTVVAIDRDPFAVNRAGKVFESYGERLRLYNNCFSDLSEVLDEAGFEKGQVSGIIADLGLSSNQLDDEERGFSFASNGELDMRMDPSSEITALDLIRKLSFEELGDIFKKLGEEPQGKRYARAIKRALAEKGASNGLLNEERAMSPAELAGVIERAAGAKMCALSRRHPATRVFMALRMKVNRELDELAVFLEQAPWWLCKGGRLAVISFHSLEDRMVKRRFRVLAEPERLVPPDLPLKSNEVPKAQFKLINRKPWVADEEEKKVNPRSRSARLRVLERSGE